MFYLELQESADISDMYLLYKTKSVCSSVNLGLINVSLQTKFQLMQCFLKKEKKKIYIFTVHD